jgi:hypothetical protein
MIWVMLTTYLSTYPLVDLPIYLAPTHSPTFLLTHQPTHLLTYLYNLTSVLYDYEVKNACQTFNNFLS